MYKRQVLIVEDVVTTGGSVREVIDLVKQQGGNVVGVGSIVDRTGGKIDFGVPFKAVISMNVESWEPDECPLCKEGKLSLIHILKKYIFLYIYLRQFKSLKTKIIIN